MCVGEVVSIKEWWAEKQFFAFVSSAKENTASITTAITWCDW